MALDLIIRGGMVVRPEGVARFDIGVENEKIVELSPEVHGSANEEIDATNLHVFPGLIDPHVHFNEPGREDWEGITTGSSALAAGGGTLFFDMPLNSSPPVLDGAAFDAKLGRAKVKSITDFAIWGGLTPNNLEHMDELAQRGVVGFKAFMSNSGIDDLQRADDFTLYEGMKRAARLGLPVAVHAESEEITSSLSRRARSEGRTAPRDYLDSRPIFAEVEAMQRAILFAAETRCPLHIVHISSAAGSMAVVEARHEDPMGTGELLDISGETCPHYLFLNEDDAVNIGARAKCAPPIRSAHEVHRLRRQLESGGIDFVASDHSPAPEQMKRSPDFFEVWGGIAGVQSTLAILLTLDLALPQIAALLSRNAAKRFRIPHKGQIAIGFDADLTLVDLASQFTLRREQLLDRHKLSPYIGRTMKGTILRTLVRGLTVFHDGKIVSKPVGRLVKPS